MAYNITTEWEDVQVQKGNYIRTKPVEVDYFKTEINNFDKFKSTEKEKEDKEKSDDEEWLKDDSEMDNYWKDMYYNKYNPSIYLQRSSIEINNIEEMRKTVLNSIDDRLSIVILYNNNNSKSILFEKEMFSYINKYLIDKSLTNSTVTIYKMVSTECINNYDDEDCPALLIYKKGIIIKKYIKCFELFMDNTQIDVNKAKEILEIISKMIVFNEKLSQFMSQSKEDSHELDFNKSYNDTYKYYDKEENRFKIYKDDREYSWK